MQTKSHRTFHYEPSEWLGFSMPMAEQSDLNSALMRMHLWSRKERQETSDMVWFGDETAIISP